MKRLAEKVLSFIRPVPPRPVESTRDELAHEIVARRRIKRQTIRLANVLSDYRRSDGMLRR